MRRYLAATGLVLVAWLGILGPFTAAMEDKPTVARLGLVPHPKALQALFPDYQQLLGASILSRVILYYGSMVERAETPGKVIYAADYPAMSRTVHAALRLDPYNMDGYYFGQAILAWDARQYQLATDLLEYGMQYRTWDWQLPFYAGFNYAYFLGNKEKAARMYMRAGELSGAPLFQKLAGRYLQEAGQTRIAVDYLQAMIETTRNPAVKESLQTRLRAFQAVLEIEKALERYQAEHGRLPGDVSALVVAGYLSSIPVDPYGGAFYLGANHEVRTTSKFAFAGADQPAPAGPAKPSPQSQP